MTYPPGTSVERLATALYATGSNAARPAAGSAGRRYLTTDNPRGVWTDTGSAWVPAGPLIVIRGADSAAKTNNTFADDDTLLWAVAANEIWFAELFALVSGANTTHDIQFSWSYPAGATIRHGFLGGLSSTVNAFGAREAGTTPLSIANETQAITTGTLAGTSGVALAALVSIGATPGNVALRWAQAVTDAGNLKLLANSFLRLTKLS